MNNYQAQWPKPKGPTPEQLSQAVVSTRLIALWSLMITIVNFLMLVYDTDFIYKLVHVL